MARNNYSAIRYKVYAILECGHEWGPLSVVAHITEGALLFCDECQESRKAEAVQSDIYSVGRGW